MEQSSHDSSEIFNHIINCDEFNYILNLLELAPNEDDSNIKCSLTDAIFNNTNILQKSKHWSLILFHKSIAINRLKPLLNYRTKAPKDIIIFNWSYLITTLYYINLNICNIIPIISWRWLQVSWNVVIKFNMFTFFGVSIVLYFIKILSGSHNFFKWIRSLKSILEFDSC